MIWWLMAIVVLAGAVVLAECVLAHPAFRCGWTVRRFRRRLSRLESVVMRWEQSFDGGDPDRPSPPRSRRRYDSPE